MGKDEADVFTVGVFDVGGMDAEAEAGGEVGGV